MPTLDGCALRSRVLDVSTWRLLASVLVILVAVVSTPSFAGEPPNEESSNLKGEIRKMTADEAADRAVGRAEFRDVSEAVVAESRAAKRGATRVPNPVLLYDREQWWQEGGLFLQDWFMVEQSFELPGVRQSRRMSADAAVEATRRERSRRERELRIEVRRSFYELLALRRRIDRAEAWVQRLGDVRELVEKRASNGKLSSGDAARATTDVESARAELESMRAEWHRRFPAFLRRVGVEGEETTWRLDGTLEGAKVDVSEREAVRLVETRGDLKALEADARSAAAEAQTARRSWIESVDVHGGYIRIAEPGIVAHGFVAGLGIPLPLFSRNRGEAQKAAARKRRLESRLTLRRREISAEVRGLVRAAEKRRKAARRFRERGAETARELVEKTEGAYRAGEVSLFELLDAQRSLYDAESKLVDLLERATLAELDLTAATGPAADDGE